MSVSPSACNKGFLENSGSCPLMLGKGLGPVPYNTLFSLWKEIEQQGLTDFDLEHQRLVNSLIRRIQPITNDDMVEGVLSFTISRSLSQIAAKLGASFDVIHQLYVPDQSSCRVDVALIDPVKDTIYSHSLLKIKWKHDLNEFPEIEVTACAGSLRGKCAIHCQWIPVFVLSRNHFRAGVAFDGVGSRWAYSEIASLTRTQVFQYDDGLLLLQFTKFLCEAAEIHRKYEAPVGPNRPLRIVNSEGEDIIEISEAIGFRVLAGTYNAGSAENHQITLKFYSCHDEAEKAHFKHNLMCSILGLRSSAAVVKGCSPGLCAIRSDHVEASPTVTNVHMRNLITKVDLLYRHGYIHGDLRCCNIVFGNDGTAHLIDFDWAGKFREALFPQNVRAASFGKRASSKVRPGDEIPNNFDLVCLADILDSFGYPIAAMHAKQGDLAAAQGALLLSKADNVQSAVPQATFSCLNLACLGMHFYARKQEEPSSKRPKSSDTARGDRAKGGSLDASGGT